jgi:hypothetical protein
MTLRKIKSFPEPKICRHPEHDPPSMIVLDLGVWEHTCPGCGKTQTIVVPHGPTMSCGRYKYEGRLS